MAFCSKCGTKLSESAKYCPVCGTIIGNNNERKAPQRENYNPPKKEKLSTGEKITLWVAAITALTGFFGGLSDGMWLAVIVSFVAMAAVIAVFAGSIEKKYAWTTAICAFFAVCLAIGLAAPDDEKAEGQITKEKHYKDMLPEDGSAIFTVENCKPVGREGLVIKSIELFEKNGSRDMRLLGVNSDGNLVELEGGWDDEESEATFQGKVYKYYRIFDITHSFYVDNDCNVHYGGFSLFDTDSEVAKAFQAGVVGKIKAIKRDEYEKAAKAAKMEAEKLQTKYLGKYYYSFFIGNTNASLHFTITLNSDGTFTHTPSNETTKEYIETEIAIDGKEYPSGGTWSASNNGVNLYFNGSWAGGKISSDMKRLEINNMNGYNLKTGVSR